ncbi:MAG TPA: RNA pyrophosphohydrolase [Pseudomonadales bacterium]|nr:RNA pyrophosphohydrolase [Pseudomonadales bacterium]
MVDSEGFRPNVGIMLANARGELLWARRVGGMDAWQFPQGGIHTQEDPESALFRELHEEVGLMPDDVRILGCTKGWLRYRLPPRLVRRHQNPLCIGQKQKWFFLQMVGNEASIQFDNGTEQPEFDHWRWVNYWYPLSHVVPFKREVYRSALKELAPFHLALAASSAAHADRHHA